MFYDKTKTGYILRVRLTPNSSCCQINGFYTDSFGFVYLKISVTAVPEKGKANKELIGFLAKTFKVAKTMFRIVSGELDRYKKVDMITTQNLEDIFQKFEKEYS